VKEHESKEAQIETVLNYSLGLLEPVEKHRLESHLRSGCADCETEVASFAQVAGALGISANAVQPPPYLRGRLLKAIADLSAKDHTAPLGAWNLVRTTALQWQPTKRQGIWEKSLLNDPVTRRSTRVIRMDPGAEIPAHRHHGDEESLVLEGRGDFGDFAFGPGDYHLARSGSLHPAYNTKDGCMFLLFSGTKYEFVPDAPQQLQSDQFVTVPASSEVWEPDRPGLDVRVLFNASKTVLQGTRLLRLRPGAALIASEFTLGEAFVVEGRARLGSAELIAGDYLQAIGSDRTSQLESEQGCTILIRTCS
jgi:anti-sigma factor ChrR (cupin superfamily)